MTSLSLFSFPAVRLGEFTAGRAVPGRTEPCWAGPGHSPTSLCVLCSPQNPVRPLTRSLYQLIRSLCCPSAGLVSPVSLYLCFACRSQPPLPLPSTPPLLPPLLPIRPPPPSVGKKGRKNKIQIQHCVLFPLRRARGRVASCYSDEVLP